MLKIHWVPNFVFIFQMLDESVGHQFDSSSLVLPRAYSYTPSGISIDSLNLLEDSVGE